MAPLSKCRCRHFTAWRRRLKRWRFQTALSPWGKWPLGQMGTPFPQMSIFSSVHLPRCPFAPNIHFPQEPICPKFPFSLVPICPDCPFAICPVPICPGAHLPQMPICSKCPFTQNFPYPPNAHLLRCLFAIVPIVSPNPH